VGLHEADEVNAGDGLDGAGGEGFGGDAVEGVLVQRGEAEDVPGAGDAEKEETAIAGGGGDFDAAIADDQEVLGGEAFSNEDRVGFSMTADADGVEVSKDGTGERTGILGTGSRTVGTGS
jgi:hypothetical protein